MRLMTLAHDIQQAAQLNGEFLLRSGQVSDQYFDKYRFEADPVLLRRVAEALVPLVPADTELLAGPELGGIPVVTVLSGLTGIPARFVRKQAKAYGTRQQTEGGPIDGRRVTVVEDVVTTAGALLDACAVLRSAGAQLGTVLCVIDREQGGRDNLAAAGLRLRSVLTRSDLESAQIPNA
jgi:orotate phosphoribosyltransferase